MGAEAHELTDWVTTALADGEMDLPVFPTVAMRLIEVLDRMDAELEDLEPLIAQDQSIMAQVLSSANSAFEGAVAPVEDLWRALRRLGQHRTGEIAMAAACREIFNLENRVELELFAELRTRIWHDALVCACGARYLSQTLSLGEPARVYVAAMLRDAGSLLILRVLARGVLEGRLAGPPDDAALAELLDSLHAPLGARYLRSSELPGYVVATAELHHAVTLPDSAAAMNLYLIRLADGLCHAIDVAPFATGRLGPAAEHAADLLGVDAEQLDRLADSFRELAEQARQLL